MIRRGVSMYSYQEEYFLGKMDLEACIRAVGALGPGTGVEVIPEQMVHEYPRLSEGFIEQWNHWMKQYNVVPTCADAFLEALLFKNRILDDDEQVELMDRDLKVASQLGCFVLRTLCTTPMNIIERSLPLAEKYGVKIGLEIHAPLKLDSPWFEPYQRLIDKTQSKWFGIIPDMGIFQRRPSPVQAARAVRDGATQKIVDFINEAWVNKVPADKVKADIARMGANPRDFGWLGFVYAMTIYTDPNVLRKHKDHIFHIHGKFYDMQMDNQDENIDYPTVVKVLKDIGYSGFISSEYEGNRTIQDAFEVDSVGQVQRQHAMLKKLIGE